MRHLLSSIAVLSVLFTSACNSDSIAQTKPNPFYSRTNTAPVKVTNAEWKKILPSGVYAIAREESTEQPFTGKYWDNHKKGTYYCAVCGNELFTSDTKFESGTGWPSFYQPYKAASVQLRADADGYRTEVKCARCGSHLGHVFDDGPRPTGKRYCMNGNVLDFETAK